MKLVEIGTVSRLHGYKGSVVVHTSSGEESALSSLTKIWIGNTPQEASLFSMTEAAWMPKGWKITLETVQSAELAETLVGKKVYADRLELPQLLKGEYYISDLVGLPGKEYGTERLVGIFSSLEETAPVKGTVSACWIFKSSSGEVSIPAVARFIHSVDIENGIIWLHNLEELP